MPGNFPPASSCINNISSCIEKTRSYKTSERDTLKAYISLNGRDADMPCTYCFKNKKECRFADSKTRCEQCVQRARLCDGVLVASLRRFFIGCLLNYC